MGSAQSSKLFLPKTTKQPKKSTILKRFVSLSSEKRFSLISTNLTSPPPTPLIIGFYLTDAMLRLIPGIFNVEPKKKLNFTILQARYSFADLLWNILDQLC